MEYLLTIILLGNGNGNGNNAISTVILPNKETCVRALQMNIGAVSISLNVLIMAVLVDNKELFDQMNYAIQYLGSHNIY